MTEPTRPSLGMYWSQVFVGRIVEKRWFGRRRIRFGRYLMVAEWLYTSGAILGRSRREKLDILMVMFSRSGAESSVASLAQQEAERRLTQYNGTPDSFFDFLLATEVPGGKVALFRDFEKDMPIEAAYPFGAMKVVEGVGFGARYPDLTEHLWRRSYENLDTARWQDARAHGLNIPEHPQIVRFEDREQALLLDVAGFASLHYAELVEPLGLRVG
ncbi:MAG: hypothetical protein HY691_06495 [Chloroflexi bacterium]|nr:hypothetical protein [Chloroflexota bacterium]